MIEPGREAELVQRLWHETVERQVILEALNELGLNAQFGPTRQDPTLRESVIVPVGMRHIPLAALINELSAWVHGQLQSLTPETTHIERLVSGAVAYATRIDGDTGPGTQPPTPPGGGAGGPGAPAKAGGIDFRYIDLMAQFQKSDYKANFKMPDLAVLRGLDLAAEKEQLDNMIAAKIVPSADRLTNYISACYLSEGPQKGMADAIACLTNFFKLEEERGVQTDPQLKSFLFFMEASGIK